MYLNFNQQGFHQANEERDLIFAPCAVAVQEGSVPTL